MKKTYTAALIITCITFLLLWHGYSSRQLVADKPTSINHTTKSIYVSPPNREELLQSVNRARHEAGVAPLTIDEGLNTSAQIKADDMSNNDYFGHVDANGKHGYEYAYEYSANCKVPSENIVGADTSIAAVNWWNTSEQHHTAMINPEYTITGIGIKYVDRIPLERITSSKPVNTDLVDSYVVVQHFCTVK